MEVEITEDLVMTREQLALLEMHSFVNLINVITAELDFLEQLYPSEASFFERASIQLQQVGKKLSESDLHEKGIGEVEEVSKTLYLGLANLANEAGGEPMDSELEESIQTLRTALEIVFARIVEWRDRRARGELWALIEPARIESNLKDFLSAMERAAKGRFRIVYDEAEHGEQDYLFRLELRPGRDGMVPFVSVLFDVVRDLVANARKYTPTGGEIRASIEEKGGNIHILVADNGNGIPPGELATVVRFGERGSNQSKRTYGGGFGLTKAYHSTRWLGGRFWISSVEHAGTCVRLSIPVPALREETARAGAAAEASNTGEAQLPISPPVLAEQAEERG